MSKKSSKRSVSAPRFSKSILFSSLVLAGMPVTAQAEDTEQLEQRIIELQQQLQAAKTALADAQAAKQQAVEKQQASDERLAQMQKKSERIKFGNLTVGGAIRANYIAGDYPGNGAASSDFADGGNFKMDTYRINLDYANGPILGKLEYRWYDGYNFMHTGWLGYQLDDANQVQVGVNRVPFGPSAYGVSQSWFFDMHYYVGLADDMDLGVKYHHDGEKLSYDFGFYPSSEGTFTGTSKDSARFSYDVVNESGNGYEEKNQFNARAIYHTAFGAVKTDLGVSMQYGQLDSKGVQDDGDHYAASAHMVNKWDNFTLATQLSYYKYDVDANQPLGTDKVVQTGAYDYASQLAAEAWIPAISLSYYKETPSIYWLDYMIPYIEYSVLAKTESSFNDSNFVNIGSAFARGNWYIYADLSMSDGNEFVGGEAAYRERLAANPDNPWQKRFNINFGYYF
jgi:hypothetical protein